MFIELKQNCKYSLLVPTSMGVRITPVNGQPVHSSNLFEMQATSAETNVASISSFLGLPVKVLTTFVQDSPIAQFIKSNLRSRNMDFEGPEVAQGDPWGYRHQFNIADSGFGTRGPRVQNDRAGEVGCTLNVKDFDLERIFGKEGVQIGIEGPEAGGKGIEAEIEGFKGMINRVKAAFPNASVFATTLRQVVNANEHLWGAIMLEGNDWQVIEPRKIPVLDRIGGGDGFVGGLLYGILKGWEPAKWPQFGWATGALATTFLTDYAQPADEDMVWSIWGGNARVKR